jgi:hypothetical protein
MAAGGNERTSGYFWRSNPESRIWFYHFWRTPLSQPLLDQVTNQLGSTLRRSRHLFDISRTFEITVSVFAPLF